MTAIDQSHAGAVVRTYGTWPQQQVVTAGPGALAGLADAIDRAGAERVLLLTTPSLTREGALIARVRETIGGRLVGEFDECRPHNPRPAVLDAAARVREQSPDLLVSFGGSTVTDAGKAVSLVMAHGLREPGDLDGVDPDGDSEVRAALTPQVAIPTTLSGAEYSAAAGITDLTTKTKRVFHQPGLAPVEVILDPAMTVATPAPLWCSTGVKSMSDAIEMLSAPGAHPFVRVLAGAAVGAFFAGLSDSSSEDPARREQARLACLRATWMSATSLANTTSRLGLGTSVRHQLGPMGVGHGDATCIMLPRILAFNWPVLGDERDAITSTFGLGDGGRTVTPEEVGERVRGFVAALGLPDRLSAVGIAREDVPGLAHRIHADPMTALNPRAASVADVERLLRAAF
ncbi:MAG: iron-containing alcohol dehydrogenase [Solirubrobacteraceae bacterium]